MEDNIKKFEGFLDRMQGLLDNAKKQGHIIVRVEDLENAFPELKESEDERIRKELIDFVKSRLAGFPECKRFTDWLEKQGEKKPILDFNADDWYVSKVDGKIHNIYHSVDEVEPKFKVGDFIANDYCFGKVIEITNDAYLLDTGQGIPFSCEHNAHLWTINDAKEEKVDNVNKVEPKFKVKYAGNEYNVFETKDIAGVTFYGIEDEPNHIDYVKAENCEIISVYAIKENGSPYPTKPAVFSEKKPKRMISAEAKEAMYDKPACVGRNDTLLDLLNKMPSCITVNGRNYQFVLRKTTDDYIACYEGEEDSGKTIFWMAGEPVDILTEMLEKLKEEGLLE